MQANPPEHPSEERSPLRPSWNSRSGRSRNERAESQQRPRGGPRAGLAVYSGHQASRPMTTSHEEKLLTHRTQWGLELTLGQATLQGASSCSPPPSSPFEPGEPGGRAGPSTAWTDQQVLTLARTPHPPAGNSRLSFCERQAGRPLHSLLGSPNGTKEVERVAQAWRRGYPQP